MKTRLAIIGNGHQVRKFHLPYLESRQDVELCWASGCMCNQNEIQGCPLSRLGLVAACHEGSHLTDWKELLEKEPPTAIIISIPNSG